MRIRARRSVAVWIDSLGWDKRGREGWSKAQRERRGGETERDGEWSKSGSERRGGVQGRTDGERKVKESRHGPKDRRG